MYLICQCAQVTLKLENALVFLIDLLFNIQCTGNHRQSKTFDWWILTEIFVKFFILYSSLQQVSRFGGMCTYRVHVTYDYNSNIIYSYNLLS